MSSQQRPRGAGAGGRRLVLLVGVFFVVTAGALAASLAGSGGHGVRAQTVTPTPAPAPSTWVATASRPARVWIGGDSLGGELVWGLAPLLKNAGVFRTSSFYKSSSGICRWDFFNWRVKMKAVMTQTKPHAVVIMLGANDTQGVRTSTGWIAYGTSEWNAAYARRVGVMMDTMLKGGARRVYWVGMPIMRQSWRNPRMKVINSICRREAAKRPGVRYIGIWSLFADDEGRYLAKWRTYDGVHLTLAGAKRLGTRVYPLIERDWFTEPPVAPSPSP